MKQEIKDRIGKIKDGEVPEGYIKINNYILNSQWDMNVVGNLVTSIRNPVNVSPKSKYRQIGIRSHGKGLFYKDEVTGEELGNKSVFWIEPDCFIVNIVFAWEMAVGRTSENEIGMIASHRFPMYKPIKNKIDLEYLTYFFTSPKGKNLLELASPGGAGRNKTLGQKEFLKMSIPLPPLPEQQKIASILSTWDKAIKLKENLIDEKKKQKKGLMQRLLTGEVRLQGFNGGWKEVTIEEVTDCLDNQRKPLNSEEREKIPGGIPYYGANGIVDYIDDFIFNENLVLLAEDGGSFEEYMKKPIAIKVTGKAWVNNHAHILRPKSIEFEYLFYSLVHKDIRKHINGTTRSKLTQNDMLTIILYIPVDRFEQIAIGNILTTSDEEITLLQQELEALKQQKKGLMQLLLTGIVRVNTEN